MSSSVQNAYATRDKKYIISTKFLRNMNYKAILNKYNRALDDIVFTQIADNGRHIIGCLLPEHTNVGNKYSMRAMIMIKLIKQDKPLITFIDISHDDWKLITDVMEEITM
jgi:hypothetical protein